MAESISFQNGNNVSSEDNSQHDIQFKLHDDGSLSLLSDIKFPKGTHNLKLNKELLKDAEFGLGELEIQLEKPIGKQNVRVFTSSSENGLFLNIKIELNENASKKYMFGADGEKKWMFGG